MNDDSAPRIEVQPMEIPWELAELANGNKDHDPIPAEIRQRFDPSNRMERTKNPIFMNIPLHAVAPGEDLLWGSTESELLNRLRTGIVTSVRCNGRAMMGKIEAVDGTVERGFLKFGNKLNVNIDQYLETYDLIDESDYKLPCRAAAAYELSKAAGLDDIIPPTVYRFDEHSGLEPILSLSAIDDMADNAGIHAEELKYKIGRSAAIELWTDNQTGLETSAWMASVSLDGFYEACPYYSEMIRGAAFDILAGTGNRTFSDIICCDNPRHPVHLMNNELTFPNPSAWGTAVLEYGETLVDTPESSYCPILWSDLVITAMLYGGDREARVFEEVCQLISSRMQGDRLLSLCRSLLDHQVTKPALAGLLARVHLMKNGGGAIMRDPLIIARYYSSLMTGEVYIPPFDIDLEVMESSINAVISKVTMESFDFRASLSGAI